MLATVSEAQTNSILLAIFFGLPLAIFLGAVILRAATAWITRIRITFGLASGITSIAVVVAAVITVPIRLAAEELGPLIHLPGTLVSFLVSCFIAGNLIRTPYGKPIGLAKGSLVTLVEYVIILIIAAICLLPLIVRGLAR